MDKINIFGINISTLKKNQIIKKIKEFLVDSRQHQIVTPNPEFLLEAKHDEEFFYILNKADLAVPDGVGLKFAAWAILKNIHRYSGADLVKDILKLKIESRKLKVVVLNWSEGLSSKEDIEKALRERYNVDYFVLDVNIDNAYKIWDSKGLVEFKPDILFVAFGAPWQDKFIFNNLKNLSTVKIAMGVGGSFDFLTGKTKRAPRIMQTIGLEWLWRLLTHFGKTKADRKRRLKKIMNAVIIFPLCFIKHHFINQFFYRKNVVGFIYNNKNKVLMVNWEKDENYWGFPQGGVDRGETIDNAIIREVKEEIGTDSFKVIAKFKNVYKYKWPKSYTNRGYKGQKQTLFIIQYLGEDDDIKITPWEHQGWQWVDKDKVLDRAQNVQKEQFEIFLKKFKETTSNPCHSGPATREWQRKEFR